EPENKASAGKLCEVPADVGQHHGTAREGNRHGSPQAYASGMFSRKRHGQERAVLGFRDPQGSETALLRLACRVRYVSQPSKMRPEPCVKLEHSVVPSVALHSRTDLLCHTLYLRTTNYDKLSDPVISSTVTEKPPREGEKQNPKARPELRHCCVGLHRREKKYAT